MLLIFTIALSLNFRSLPDEGDRRGELDLEKQTIYLAGFIVPVSLFQSLAVRRIAS